MPLKDNSEKIKKELELEQQHIDRLCPFMSRRITHPAFGECGHEEELVRQPCVETDCACWDAENECCSLSSTSMARGALTLAELATKAWTASKKTVIVQPEPTRKRPRLHKK